MPIYEFKCNECNSRFSVLVPFSRKGQSRCPHCSSSDLREVFDNYSLHVGGKGSCQAPPRSGFS